MRAALILGVLAGCYDPSLQDCAVTCVNNACPSGFECVTGVCRSSTGACPGGGGSADAPVLMGFAFRKKITLSDVPGGFVTNFPLTIRRLSDPDLANFAQTDGADIQFTAADGTALASEIERFDETTGELVAWVNVPEVSATTELYMYFGSTTASAPPATAVWDSNYIGVWHLSDPPGASVADSTSAALAAQKATTSGPTPTLAGFFAGGHVFTGGGAENLTIGSSAAVTPPELTFETWINYALDNSDSYRALFATPNSAPQHPALIYPNQGTPQVIPKQSLGVALASQAYFTQPGTFIPNIWNHVVLTTSGSLAGTSVYINGVKLDVTSMGQLFPSGSTVTFGGLGNTQLSVMGTMDEIRYSKTLRPAAYVIASYAYASTDTLVTFGPVEAVR
jgi:hypothetical protein